jgi:hypothetical protein
MTAPKSVLRWSQLTPLVLMLLASIGLSWVAVRSQQSRRQRELATKIDELGGHAGWHRPMPLWVQGVLGEDFLGSVQWVEFINTPADDASLECLEGLSQLEWLTLQGPQVTDADLERLQRLTQLRVLQLKDTRVTEAGVMHLQQALPSCEIIR